MDQSLQIWHAFFGLLGGKNEIHVLNKFPLVNYKLVDKWIYKQVGLCIFLEEYAIPKSSYKTHNHLEIKSLLNMYQKNTTQLNMFSELDNSLK